MKYDRSVSSLIILILDVVSQQIIKANMLKPEDDEILECIRMFCEIIEDFGKPTDIFIRNPRVYSSLVFICDECQIDVHVTSLPMLDDIIDDMNNMM